MSPKKDHVVGEKPPNPITGDWGGKPILGLSLKTYYFLALLLKLSSGRPRFRLVLRGRAVGGRTIVGRDHHESSCRKSSYRGSNHRWLSYQR